MVQEAGNSTPSALLPPFDLNVHYGCRNVRPKLFSFKLLGAAEAASSKSLHACCCCSAKIRLREGRNGGFQSFPLASCLETFWN